MAARARRSASTRVRLECAIRQRRDKDKEFREAMRGYFQQFHQIQ